MGLFPANGLKGVGRNRESGCMIDRGTIDRFSRQTLNNRQDPGIRHAQFAKAAATPPQIAASRPLAGARAGCGS
jgi:hypothetical protein